LGAPLPADRFAVDEAGVLTVSPVRLEDAGNITCTVTNSYGRDSTTATIQVLCEL